MFYDLYERLCKEKGVSLSRAAVEIGLSNSIVTKWKKTQATPSGDTLSKIAEYFGVSVDYLLGNEQKEKPAQKGEPPIDNPAFYRLRQGLEPYDLSDADVTFLLTVYKAHIQKNE